MIIDIPKRALDLLSWRSASNLENNDNSRQRLESQYEYLTDVTVMTNIFENLKSELIISKARKTLEIPTFIKILY